MKPICRLLILPDGSWSIKVAVEPKDSAAGDVQNTIILEFRGFTVGTGQFSWSTVPVALYYSPSKSIRSNVCNVLNWKML